MVVNPDIMLDGIASLAAGISTGFPGLRRVAGYVDGRYAWTAAEWGLFPDADHVHIAVRASTDKGDVLDVENGDATPAEAPGWIRMRHAAGLYRPTVYCSLAVVPAVRRETGSLILGKDYDIWVAHYDNSVTPPACPGLPVASFAAKQYQARPDCDVSVVYDPAWPHRQPDHPAPVPAPASPSGTATAANVSWQPVPGATSYRVQWRDHDGNITQALTAAHGRILDLTGPGPHSWRVQAAGGAWTGWLPIG